MRAKWLHWKGKYRMPDPAKPYMMSGFDSAFLGVALRPGMLDTPVAVYDRGVCLHILRSRGLSDDQALEFLDKQLAVWLGAGTPMMVRRMPISEYRDLVEDYLRDVGK